jgi:hypothetical protein
MSMKVAPLLAIALVVAGCSNGGSTGGGAAAPPKPPAAPAVSLDGNGVDIGHGTSLTLSLCKDKPSPKVDKTIAWQGQGGGAHIAELTLSEITVAGKKKSMLDIRLPNGDLYDTSMKFTKITISGPADGIYSFSGTVHKDVPATSDEGLRPIGVEGSITCANYNVGTVAGCKYASVTEISTTTGLSLDQTRDDGLRGCQYNATGSMSFARLEYFPTAGWDEYVNSDAQRYGRTVEDVPDLGSNAKQVGPVIYVRTTAARSFGVFVQDTRPFDARPADALGPTNAAIAIAKLVGPRVAADSQ